MTKSFFANKKLGQHFLKDKNAISVIIKSMPIDASTIIEIGPGPGAITEHLLPLNKKILLVEKDLRFVEHWNQMGIKCIEADAMKMDWNELLNFHQLKNEKFWLVSNLPYNISAPLTIQLLKIANFQNLTLMYQKEVAEKFLGIDGMCSLYALSQAFFDVAKILNLKPGAFNPPPQVDSMVLTFSRKKNSIVPMTDFNKYENFLRNLFAYPRKQLNSVLIKFMPPRWEQDKKIIPLDLTLRAEKLSWEQLLQLYSYYC